VTRAATRLRATAARVNLQEIGVLEDPYPALAALRTEGRLLSGGPGQWVASHYQDVASLLRDSRLGHEFPEEYHHMAIGAGAAGDFVGRIILNRDPPAHTVLRRAMTRALSPRHVSRLSDRIAAMAAELLEPALERGTLEVVDELAFPLPIKVACELIGIPPADEGLIRHWSEQLTKAFGVRTADAERVQADTAVRTLRDYVEGLLRDRERGLGGDPEDLASLVLAASRADSRLSREDVVDNIVFLFFAGFETTVNLIATGSHLLLEHPDELARLRDDRSLVGSAVEEFLRYDGPILSTSRLVREELTVAGRRLRPGRVVHLLLAAANRDPEQFGDPDRLDVGRAPNAHLAFSGGPHYCLGAALARLESAAAFSCILERCRTFLPAGPATRRLDPSFRSLASVPASVGAA
jgi:cytochrome P450